ncbi:hypothetical protein [Paraburkholderia youngii]|uniref:hypothetical protein n=1 Tax=Paraburkholderia youngii TaxID=2782701 RepID=UPI001595CF20|nr:hypothetical protein [Paraburkholderia youngii]
MKVAMKTVVRKDDAPTIVHAMKSVDSDAKVEVDVVIRSRFAGSDRRAVGWPGCDPCWPVDEPFVQASRGDCRHNPEDQFDASQV